MLRDEKSDKYVKMVYALCVCEGQPMIFNQANAVSINGVKITLDDLAKQPSRLHDRYALIRHGKKSYFLADFGA